jgi:hypothetical protein
MLLQLSIYIPGQPVKYAMAEIDLDAAQVDRARAFPPDSISGKLVDSRTEEWLKDLEQTEAGTPTIGQEANVVLAEEDSGRLVNGRFYKFTHLGDDGAFGLRLQPRHPLPVGN